MLRRLYLKVFIFSGSFFVGYTLGESLTLFILLLALGGEETLTEVGREEPSPKLEAPLSTVSNSSSRKKKIDIRRKIIRKSFR